MNSPLMNIVSIDKFGSPEVAAIKQQPKPVVASGQVLIKLKASSVNPVDAQIRQGHYQAFTPLPFNLGFDGAGVIEQVANDVSQFKPGDRVYFVPPILNGQGTYAQYCAVDANLVMLIPEGLSFNQAAALSLAGSAAWEALMERGALQQNETVLIHAGAGGVGHLAIQIAKAAGARVITTAKIVHHARLAQLGADIVLDYRAEDFPQQLQRAAGQGIHLVLDTVAGNTIQDAAAVLAPYGRIVSLADYCPPQDLLGLWPKNAAIHLMFMNPSAQWLAQLNGLVERGKLQVIVDKVFPFEQVQQAHHYLASAGRCGKTVLSID